MDKELLSQAIGKAFVDFKYAIRKHQDINIKRADGGWSVGEIADHIIKSANIDFGATENTERPYDQHASAIKDLFLNFQLKFPVAPMLKPDSKQYRAADLFSLLDERKEAIFKMIERDDLAQTCTDIQLPVWGTLTKYEWLVLIENHIIRHTRQVSDFNKVAV